MLKLHRVLPYMLLAINKALALIGLTLKRTAAPTRSFAWFFRHIKRFGFDFRYIIDVGVGYGTHDIYRAFPRAKYLLIEPLDEFRGVLDRLSGKIDADYHIAAAGSREGTTIINVHGDLTGSSVLRQAEGPAMDGTAREVKAVRLEGLLPKELPRPALLKVDTQGTELEVIAGLGSRVNEIDAIIVEVSLMSFRHGCAQFYDVVARMKDLGFVAYDILEGHSRFLDGALAQVDIVFVPEDSALRQVQSFFAQEQVAGYLRR